MEPRTSKNAFEPLREAAISDSVLTHPALILIFGLFGVYKVDATLLLSTLLRSRATAIDPKLTVPGRRNPAGGKPDRRLHDGQGHREMVQ